MKIRIMGTKEECLQAQEYYNKFSEDNELVKYCSVSTLYPNRNSKNQYRVYIDIVCDNYVNAMNNNEIALREK